MSNIDVKSKAKREVGCLIQMPEKISDKPENIAKIALASLKSAQFVLNSKPKFIKS